MGLKEEKWVKQSLSATPLTATSRNQRKRHKESPFSSINASTTTTEDLPPSEVGASIYGSLMIYGNERTRRIDAPDLNRVNSHQKQKPLFDSLLYFVFPARPV